MSLSLWQQKKIVKMLLQREQGTDITMRQIAEEALVSLETVRTYSERLASGEISPDLYPEFKDTPEDQAVRRLLWVIYQGKMKKKNGMRKHGQKIVQIYRRTRWNEK